MSHHHPHRRFRRTRIVLKCSILLLLLTVIGVLLWQPWARVDRPADISRAVPPVRPGIPELRGALPDNPAEWTALRKLWQDALDNDGRVLESGVAVRATGLSARKSLQLALDEVFSLGRNGAPSMAGRIRPVANRGELEKFVLDRVAGGGPVTYPVLYVKDAFRVPGNVRIATGEIITLLNPGVPAAEIARQYQLEVRPAHSSGVGLTRFIARNAFRALEIVPKLAADPRIALVDHDLLKPVQGKALVPDDPFFGDQWAIAPVLGGGAERDLYNIGLYPTLSQPLFPPEAEPIWRLDNGLIYIAWGPLQFVPNLAPVWGDFEESDDGFRGRGIRVGIVDDGLEVGHQDLQRAVAPSGEHRGYDIEEQAPRFPGDVPPPRVRGASGFSVEPIKLTQNPRSHGMLAAGVIGARANNKIGIAGVAPESVLVGIRAYSYSHIDNSLERPDPTFYRPIEGDLLSPTQDVVIAAAFEFAKNDGVSGVSQGKRIYTGTFYETDLPGFSDSGAGPLIHVKNVGFGAPDSGVIDGPGPEVDGVWSNGQFTAGARDRALRDGRLGLGTVFVQPAGNGRYQNLENANNDGYANARGAITVGSVGRFVMIPTASNEDTVSIVSEWGANLTVVAPGGGPFHGGKGGGSRSYNGRPMNAAIVTRGGVNGIATTDWTINEPAKQATSTTPALPPLFGLNPTSGAAGDYTDGTYTKRFQGTSAAGAHVSGVIALMLEANPRLSWLDVQHILIRTARKHFDPEFYVLDPAAPIHPPIPDGVDINDIMDPVLIDQDWEKNSGHMWFNHKYGAGLVDAGRAVAEASIGVLLPTQTDMLRFEFTNGATLNLPDAKASNTPPGEVTMNITANVPQNFVITHTELRIDRILTAYIGEVFISMTAPGGMESILLEPRLDGSDDMVDWSFSSLRHWGENGLGVWTITFRDYIYDGSNATFDDAVINKNRPGETGSPTTRLILHGYLKPEIPVISRPSSKLAAEPTVVEVTRGKNFSYSMTASNRPTTWLVLEPPLTPNTPGLPPGIRLGTVLPAEATTYLPSRLLTGRTNEPIGSIFDVQVVAANAGGLSEERYLRLVVVPPESGDPYTQWADYHFPPFALGNPLAEGTADGDGDGMITALEYGLGTSPVVPDGSGAVALAKDASDNWTFTFKRFPTRGVTYEVQTSSSLEETSWTTVVRSDPALVDPDPGAGGVPVSLDPTAFSVSEGELVPAGDEPQSEHRVVTVVNNPAKPPPLYYRLRVIPPRDPLSPQ
ncbi:MAG: S8 family serine peptidase [Verrucomicrobiales bacterium]